MTTSSYTRMDDARLESEYRVLLEAYVDRMEAFASLPGAFTADGIRETHADLDGHGITPSEWHEYLAARVEHIAEGARLADVASERLARIRGREKARIASLDAEALHAELQALDAGGAPGAATVEDGGTVRDIIMRRERWREDMAVREARVLGIAAAVDKMVMGGAGDARMPGDKKAKRAR